MARGGPNLVTVLDQIAWSYANLGRAHAALTANRTSYIMVDHMIRAKLYNGLRSGTDGNAIYLRR